MWVRRLYPALFAVYPVLAMAGRNLGRFDARDAVIASALSLVVVAIGFALTYAVLRRWQPAERAADWAALAVGAVIALFYGYPLLRRLAQGAAGVATPLAEGAPGASRSPGGAGRLVAALVVALVVIAAVALAARGRGVRSSLPPLRKVSGILTLAGALLTVVTGARLVYVLLADEAAVARSSLARELARPVRIRPGAARPTRRDVYVIVLDEYPDSAVLRERYHFDNRPFLDSLRALGFRLPAAVRSNYAVTVLSVTSLLNFAHVRPLEDVVGPRSTDYTPASYLLQHDRAARFLKGQGYRFVYFPSIAFTPTESNADADERFHAHQGFDPAWSIYGSEIGTEFVYDTPLRLLQRFMRPYTVVRAEHATRTLAALTALPARPGPTLAVAHVLMPHLPFVVDADCRPLPAPDWRAENAAALAGQLSCLNALTLRTVGALLKQSAIPPIIILQGDHGSQALHPFENTAGGITTEQARERFRAFGAYYLPDGGAAAMPDTVSVVNVLRHVFTYYFGADLPPIPDDMYFSSWRTPYAMLRVDNDFRVQPDPTRVK